MRGCMFIGAGQSTGPPTNSACPRAASGATYTNVSRVETASDAGLAGPGAMLGDPQLAGPKHGTPTPPRPGTRSGKGSQLLCGQERPSRSAAREHRTPPPDTRTTPVVVGSPAAYLSLQLLPVRPGIALAMVDQLRGPFLLTSFVSSTSSCQGPGVNQHGVVQRPDVPGNACIAT